MLEQPRQHITEIDIDATPDQVFRALTEAEQIVRWFAPEAKVEPGPDGKMLGGSYYVSWGPGVEATSTITIWEPGVRFAAVSERPEGEPSTENDTVHRILKDYQIESRGGKTHLRLVHSGFGRGSAWDHEFEGTKSGWPIFLWILKHGLERHPGVDSVTVSIIVPCPVSAEEAWRRLIPAGLKPGDRYKLAQGCEGIVRTYNPPEAFGGNVENLNDALIGIYCNFTTAGGRKFVNVSFVLWGPARDRANELQTAWKQSLMSAVAAAAV